MLRIYKKRLEKVCKVLFPKYKRVTVNDITGLVKLYTCKWWLIRWFLPKWKISLNELLNYQIPKKLADFKYDNEIFINVVQSDLVQCELDGRNKIDYFLEEITKIKYADIFKSLDVTPEDVTLNHTPDDEDEMFQEMMRVYAAKERLKSSSTIAIKPQWVSKETVFYTLLFLIVAFDVVIRLIK